MNEFNNLVEFNIITQNYLNADMQFITKLYLLDKNTNLSNIECTYVTKFLSYKYIQTTYSASVQIEISLKWLYSHRVMS